MIMGGIFSSWLKGFIFDSQSIRRLLFLSYWFHSEYLNNCRNRRKPSKIQSKNYNLNSRYGANSNPKDGGSLPVIAILDKLLELAGSHHQPQLNACLKIILKTMPQIEMPYKVRYSTLILHAHLHKACLPPLDYLRRPHSSNTFLMRRMVWPLMLERK